MVEVLLGLGSLAVAALGYAWWRYKPPVLLPAPLTIADMTWDTPAPEEIEPEPVRVRARRGPQQAPASLKRDIESVVTEIIERFEKYTRIQASFSKGTWIMAHDDLIACDFHYVDELAERTQGYHSGYLAMFDQQNEQVKATWPIDIAWITDHRDPEEDDRHKGDPSMMGFSTTRVCSVEPKDVRSQVRMVVPKMLVRSWGMLNQQGEWWAEKGICGLVNGKWIDIGNRVIQQTLNHDICRDPPPADETHAAGAMGLAIALTERYSWHVAFGTLDGPRLLLPTSPAGIVALFKDRDKGEKGRREALKHWVRTHWRELADDESALIFVREHLRGKTRFAWRGFPCEVLVSAYDLEKNEFFRSQADQWRSQRKHNRVRLKVKR